MPPGSQTLLICISIEMIVRHKNVDMHHQNVFELFCKNNKKKPLKNSGSQTQFPDKCDMKHG